MKRFFALALCLLLLLPALALPGSAAAAVEPASIAQRLDLPADTQVNAIVVLSDDADTAAVLSALGPELAVTQVYDRLLRGFAVDAAFGDLAAVEALPGVKKVCLSNVYTAQLANDYSGNTAVSAALAAGADDAWAAGYTGQGILVAVLDTGLNTVHECFAVYDGVLGEEALTRQDSQALTAALGRGGYVSDKVPYAWDYTSGSADVTDLQGHGTHVSASAVGYVPGSQNAPLFSGAAPGAQLLAMKVFDDTNQGAVTSVLFRALEDALLLGADVVNLSLGSVNGFSVDVDTLSLEQDVYQTLRDAGVIVCCAAGNEASMAYGQQAGGLSADYADYGVLCSPASLRSTTAIASVESDAYYAQYIQVDGQRILFSDTSPELSWSAQLGDAELAYVAIPGLGAKADYADAAVARTIFSLNVTHTPWVAVVERGELYFADKLANADAAGAAAMICYNNIPGDFAMEITQYVIPAVSVTAQAGQLLLDAANPGSGQGLLRVSSSLQVYSNQNAGQISTFSSWGTTSDLLAKPELTAVGGSVWSAWTGGSAAYASASGTSMASGCAAGDFACILQYVRQTRFGVYRSQDKPQAARQALALLESTAQILTGDGGAAFSPRQQGAGAIDLSAAVSAQLTLDQPLLALGDDSGRSGTLKLDWTVQNAAAKPLSAALTVTLLTDLLQDGLSTLTAQDLAGGYEVTVLADGQPVQNLEGLTFAPGDTRLSVTLQLTDACLEALAQDFENGAYLEGYVTLTPQSGSAVHGTFWSYWGSWSAGSLLSCYDYADVLDALTWLQTHDYAAPDYDPFLFLLQDGAPVTDSEGDFVYDPDGVTLTWAQVGFTYQQYLDQLDGDGQPLTADLNWAYAWDGGSGSSLLGDNPFVDTAYNPERNAISTQADALSNLLLVQPSQLRNARRLLMLIADDQTGQLYSVDDLEYLSKLYYDDGWTHDYYLYWDLTDRNPASASYGQPLPQGTQVTVRIYGWVDYDTDAEAAFQALPGAGFQRYQALLEPGWDGQLQWSFQFTIDSAAPQLLDQSWDPVTHTLTLEVTDDQYLAYAALNVTQAQTWNRSLCAQAVTESEAGAVTTLVFDLDDDIEAGDLPEQVYLSLADYAGNCTPAISISLTPSPAITRTGLVRNRLTVHLENVQDGRLVAAVYSGEGAYLGCAQIPVQAGQTSTQLLLDHALLRGGSSLRLLLLDAQGRPQCEAEAISLSQHGW